MNHCTLCDSDLFLFWRSGENWYMSGPNCMSSSIGIDVSIESKKKDLSVDWHVWESGSVQICIVDMLLISVKDALGHVVNSERFAYAVQTVFSQRLTGLRLIETRCQKYCFSFSCPKRGESVALRLVRTETYVFSFWLLGGTEIDSRVHTTDLFLSLS